MDRDTTVCKAVFGLAEGREDFSTSKLLWSRFVELKSGGAHAATAQWTRGVLWLQCEKNAGRRTAQVTLAVLAVDPDSGDLRPDSNAPVFGSKLDEKSLRNHMDRAGYDVDDDGLDKLYWLARACARTLTTQKSFHFSVDEKSQQLHLGLAYEDGSAANMVFDVVSRRADAFMVGFMLDVAFSLMPEQRRQELHQRYVLEQEQSHQTWPAVLLEEPPEAPARAKRLTPEETRERSAKISQEFSQTLNHVVSSTPDEDVRGSVVAASTSHSAEASAIEAAPRPRKRQRVKTGRKRRARGFVRGSDDSDGSDGDE